MGTSRINSEHCLRLLYVAARGNKDSGLSTLNIRKADTSRRQRRINGYITRKVGDKAFRDLRDREGSRKKFDNIGLFVKYGIINCDGKILWLEGLIW